VIRVEAGRAQAGMTFARRLLPLLVAGALVAGCGSSSSSTSNASPTPSTSPGAAAPGSAVPTTQAATVRIVSYKFAPPTILLKRGGTVTFTNRDPTAHTATADAGPSFDTGSLGQGQSKTIRFGTAGTFAYHCVFHAFMTGSVVVS
jgi:plastocyanin